MSWCQTPLGSRDEGVRVPALRSLRGPRAAHPRSGRDLPRDVARQQPWLDHVRSHGLCLLAGAAGGGCDETPLRGLRLVSDAEPLPRRPAGSGRRDLQRAPGDQRESRPLHKSPAWPRRPPLPEPLLLREDRFGRASDQRAILYVVRNPVTAGLCEHAGLWPDSSYRATVGLERAPRWLVVDQVLSLFGSSRESARAEFKRLVQSGQLLVSDTGLSEPLSDVDTATAVRSAA